MKKGGGRASIHDVASRAGVSAATVSKFLHGVQTIKPANVARIKVAINELDYRLDPLAADLRRSRRNIIGFIVPDLESEFFGALASRLEILAEEQGYSLSIASSHESEERELKLVERMNDWRVAGTILAPVRSERGLGAERMKEVGMDGVFVDRVQSDARYDTIGVDNARASAAVCRAFCDLGHRHVLLLGLGEVSRNVRLRINGFRDEAARICPDMRVDAIMGDGGVEDLRAKLGKCLDSGRPTAVYSLFQKGTHIALSEFRRRGIRCPEDISLIGFDDADWMQVTYPSVSAVAQPVEKLADSAFELLMERLNADKPVARMHLEDCRLVLRESISAVPDGRDVGKEKAT
ncbi:MAG: LacI family DNA-binding transcriptional regulator [Tropicimonas sp.]|uniref:LacI family DNA-binding transcriptional regulator n=1 Tax=Tropicimonas sp. TaxID=2067044 RepID=UPI003A8C7F0E